MKEKILELLRESDGFVSGQEISDRFSVSRTSVWKAIRQLESMGYVIEAVRNRGYRLCSEPDLLTADLVTEYLQAEIADGFPRASDDCPKEPEETADRPRDAWVGHPVLVFDSLDSTNNEAKRRAEVGAGEGLLVIAGEQTSGRGRRGRTWESERGDGICMSLLLRPEIGPGSASMLTLVMGLAVRDALAEICGESDTEIKWPNDIVVDGKKVCGILTEMSAEMDEIHYVVIGIGINVHNTEFSEDVAQTATSVWLQSGRHICRAQLVAECMRRFEEYYEVFLQTWDLRGLMDAYNAHLVNLGREVCILGPEGNCIGTAFGINARGELIVGTDMGERLVSSGEVSVRGVYGYI